MTSPRKSKARKPHSEVMWAVVREAVRNLFPDNFQFFGRRRDAIDWRRQWICKSNYRVVKVRVTELSPRTGGAGRKA